jgi:hypothetical protein
VPKTQTAGVHPVDPTARRPSRTRFKLEHVNGNWLADQLARLGGPLPEVHLVFADSRRFAEDWTYRFLTTVLADTIDPSSND